MNDSKYRFSLYVIISVIVATISIQAYWNYKNYLSNKKQLIADVQASLDNAVSAYYSNLAEKSTYKFSFKEGEINEKVIVNNDTIYDRILGDIDFVAYDTILDSIHSNDIKNITVIENVEADTIIKQTNGIVTSEEWVGDRKIIKEIMSSDSLKKKDFELLTAQVMLKISNDTIDIKYIDTLLKEELDRKHINVAYTLTDVKDINDINSTPIEENQNLVVESTSSFLPQGTRLRLQFSNEMSTVLKRIFVGILISCLLVAAVIACLFYLLKIIKNQKQLAEIKNDFISNMTHEFKTPIATIGVALEGVKNFNSNNDKEKTSQYVDISNQQLAKLNVMVEKLLETATLDSDTLDLNLETCNVYKSLNTLVETYQLQIHEKTINVESSSKTITAYIDVFHFENALNNLLDNAVKYGGDKIKLTLHEGKNEVVITVSDNGTSLLKSEKDKVIEKFYRVSKGNQHDVKGYGIGLYYAKKIIEKHKGAIYLELGANTTKFIITIPKHV